MRVDQFSDYGREEPEPQVQPADANRKPWAPFRTRLDFELSELMLEAALNRQQISKLISLIHRSQAQEEEDEGITIKSVSDLEATWKIAAKRCVNVS